LEGLKSAIIVDIILMVINMLYRKAYEKIKEWYSSNENALLVDGARQVGKTTIIRSFLHDNVSSYVELNLIENKDALDAFNTSSNANELMLKITAIAKTNLVEGESVIFIDEAQEAKDALTPIKFLIEQNKYKFIFSGSLLGVKLKNIQSIGVGYITILNMFPMDFEEFILACGVSKNIIEYVHNCFINLTKVDDLVHNQLMKLFNLYLVVGGMPKPVNEYVISNNIQNVIKALEDIDFGYLKDITKYDKEHKFLIEDIYNLIPSELNQPNKRMILKNLNEKVRFYQYEESFIWLLNSGVGLFVYNIDNPKYPLLASKERTLFKLFLCDTGLLSYKLLNGNQIKILNGEVNMNYGAIYEAVIAQELTSHGFPLFYCTNKKRGEIDFIIEKDAEVIPLEIKSGKNYKRHSAIDNLLNEKEFNIKKGYVLNNNNVQIIDNCIYLPIYMIMFFNNKNNIDNPIYKVDITALKK